MSAKGDRYFVATVEVVIHIDGSGNDKWDMEQASKRAKRCFDAMAPALVAATVGTTSVYDIKLANVREAADGDIR